MQVGLPALLFLVFLVLKLCHFITWSWLWVTAPLWITFLIVGVSIVILGYAAVANQKRFMGRWNRLR